MKKRLLSLVLAGALLLMTACGGGGKPSAQESSGTEGSGSGGYKDTLKVGLDVDPETLDPRLSRDVSGSRVFEQVCDPLVEVNEKLEPVPCLAESWENPDELTWIFHLKKDVKFHDGSDFTAEDVKFTFDSIRNPDLNAPNRANYASIEEVVVVDDYTVQFNLSEPYSPLLVNNMTLWIVPAEADSIENFASHPIGTGPYVFKEWSKNNKLVMEANPNYWGEAPKTKNIEYYIIPENATRTAALESGDVDLIHTPLTPQDIERVAADSKFKVDKMSGLGITFACFNHKSEVLSDKQVRIGLSYFIDKETMASELGQGVEQPGKSILLPSSWAYSDSVTGYEYNPEKGKEVLKAAGWEDHDGDGILDKDGKKLSLTIKTYTQDDLKMQTAEYMQNLFTSNGVDAQVLTYEWPSFIADVQSGNFDIAIIGMLNMVDPDKYMYLYLRSAGGSNWGGYSSTEFDTAVETARATSDQAERAKLYQTAAQINNDEVMHNVLIYQGYVAMYNANLEGYVAHPAGYWRSFKNVTVKA